MASIKNKSTPSGNDNDNGKRPRYVEIIRRPTTTKTNRERDNRIQWGTFASMFICMGLVVSVLGNVYQSIAGGGFDFYAQDIRTGDLLHLKPIPMSEIPADSKVGPAPIFTEAQMTQSDKDRKERSAWLNALHEDGARAQQMAQINVLSGDASVLLSQLPVPPGAERRVAPAAQPDPAQSGQSGQVTPPPPIQDATTQPAR